MLVISFLRATLAVGEKSSIFVCFLCRGVCVSLSHRLG